MSRWNLRKRPRVCYYEPEEPPFDEFVFCSECRDYVYEYCSIHGPLLIIPDERVPAKTGYPAFVPRAALTIPRVFLHLATSDIKDAGIGVFSTLTLPAGVRFGPYRGARAASAGDSSYAWQIYDKNYKPLHVVDARDGNNSNWMRYVNCSRHSSEQNLVAYQYRGQLYYRTTKLIPRFTELLVFYGSQFANLLGIDLRLYSAPCHCDACQAQKLKKAAPGDRNKRQPRDEDIQRQNKTAKNSIEKRQVTPLNIQVELQSNIDATVSDNSVITQQCKEQVKQNKRPAEAEPKPKKRKIPKIVEKEPPIKPVTPVTVAEGLNKTNNSNNKNTDIEKHVYTHKSLDNTTVSRETNSGTKPFKCKHGRCSYSFSETGSLINHERTHTGEKPYKCNRCSYSCRFKCSLITHERTHIGEKPYKCNHCSYSCSAKSSLTTHERTHTGEKPYKCNHCSYSCSQKQHLIRHEGTHTGEKPYKCNHCSYSCSDKRNLITHERTHTGEKPYKCNHCRFSCSQKANLITHEKTHTGEKPYKCNHCSYSCSQKVNLITHERTHTGEKPYKCNHCSYSCSQKVNLITHERTHTGEKPYKCNHCSYSCSDKFNLIRHERTHTGEKPYKCNHCSYSCSQKVNLITHERTHTGEKPYKCNHCSYSCRQKHHLITHKRTHTGEKPYKCNHCSYSCSAKSRIRTHIASSTCVK